MAKDLFNFKSILEEEANTAKGCVFNSDPEVSSSFFRGAGIDALRELLPLPLKQNHNYHFVSRGDWSLWELVQYLLPEKESAAMWFSTWSMSELSTRKLITWMESGRINKVNALVDYRAKNRHPEAYYMAKNNIANMRVTSVHAKVVVMQSMSTCITIVGSANWTENPRIETGIISTEKAVAEMHIKWINEVIKNGSYEF
jgi:hypothetical protein